MSQPKDSKSIFQQKTWLGISNFLKEPSSQDPNQPTSYWYSEKLDVRTDPWAITLHPATQKESGSTVTDFVKWADITPASLVTYAYGDSGNIYSRTAAGSWALLHQTASSHGNGLQYFYGDDYVYYTGDMALGRYGPLASSPTFSDDFLTAQGGVPQNTYSLGLISASSQSADAADSASLSVTSDLTLEAYFYLNSLPAIGSSMTLIGKWDESGTLMSYKMDIYGVSGYFGDGSDGALTISVDTTEAPIDSACSGTATTYVLTATNASFVIGQQIWIHQTQGTNAGQQERNVITGYTAGTITLQTPLVGTYGTGAQVRVLKQYTNVTVNTGKTWTGKAWDGTVGGIGPAFLANGTITNSGTISANAIGFRQAAGPTAHNAGSQGEGYAGVAGVSTAANGNGGGGGTATADNSQPGAGGGHGVAGTTPSGGAIGGGAAGTADLTTMSLGGAGGRAGASSANNNNSPTGHGGGGIFIAGVTLTNTGAVTSNGGNGANATTSNQSGSGGGAGGSISIKCQTATLGSGLILASGGAGGVHSDSNTDGGAGAVGRIAIAYLTSYTGTTTPTLTATQDNTLVTTATYQARVGISQNGTTAEYLTKNLPSLTTAQWNRLSISWTAASSLATFYQNGTSLGTTTGTKTAIHDNASLLYVGANKGASAIQNYLNGYIDDVRVWGAVRSASDIYAYNNKQLTGNEGNLKAYYKLNNAATDATANTNTLTLRNAPVYSSTIIPFVDPTTRLDIDQSFTTTGFDYDVLTAISELAVDTLSFTPASDPQKSVDFNVGTKGTGDWTVTVHDNTNTVIASKTITTANMASAGYQEFTWATPWRIVIGKSYHMHVTSTVADGTIIASVDDDFSKANFHTYYQFLVNDTLFHPIARMLNFLVIGNERYLAKWDGAFFSPNYIAFPAGTHVRCIGYWGKYLAIGTWQEASSGTPTVYDFPTGKIYFWDGISLTFNFSIDIPEGQVNAIYGMDASLYYFAGFKGDLMYYQGTFDNQSGEFNGTKIKRIPYIERSKYVEVYPQSMGMWRGLLHFGMGANTNSTTLPQGVYSWGTLYPQYQSSLSFDHVISTGNKGSTVRIGMIYPVGQKLLISWKDGIAYGVDVVDPTGSVYYTSGLIQPNLQDGEMIYANNLLLKIRADHLALNTGEGVQVGYKLNREANFEVANSTTDSVSKQFTSSGEFNGRTTEWQGQVTLTGNGTSSPTLLSFAALTDSLISESQQF